MTGSQVFEWTPKRGRRFDVAWFDIWNDKCGNNAAEMTRLKKKFGRRITGWKSCWAERHVRRMNRTSR